LGFHDADIKEKKKNNDINRKQSPMLKMLQTKCAAKRRQINNSGKNTAQIAA
jgi:ABC-type Fe3+/spermidine/putrescine transport system ATPase subunit